jgi:branched-chain amino acid transport system ATP-binding protein
MPFARFDGDRSGRIRKLKEMGLTILCSEQNLRFARRISDRADVIENGRIRGSATMAELHEGREIRKKYLPEKYLMI